MRDADNEGGASPYFAVDFNSTTVCIDDFFHDSKPKPGTLLTARRLDIQLLKRAEYLVYIFGWDPRPMIGDGYFQFVPDSSADNKYFAT